MECCKKGKRKINANRFGFISALIIALIPKCPLCIMAYSGAITLCTGKKMLTSEPTHFSYLAIGLGIMILALEIINFHKKKTPVAILVTLIGLALIFISEWISGNAAHYQVGAFFLFIGVWLNGSLPYFLRKIKSIFYINTWSSRQDQPSNLLTQSNLQSK